jgi:hypothetical protein
MEKKSNKAQINRNKLRESLKNEFLVPIICSLSTPNGNKNFAVLKDFSKLMIKHFQNDIPLFNTSNSMSTNEKIFSDFRDGSFFKKIFLPKIVLFKNVFLYNVYFDGTNIHQNKSIINCYLTILNDKLIKMNKKFIYNISFISKEILKEVTMKKYLNYLVSRFKNELSKIELNGKSCFGFLFSVIGDNQEVYNILNLKVSFSKSIFRCRVCDCNTLDTKENMIKNYNNYHLRNNENYFEEIKLRKRGILYRKFYNPDSVSDFFMFDYVDYLWSFPLDIQHIEFEGEVQRELILFSFFFIEIDKSLEFKLMIQFLKSFMKTEGIVNFFTNINQLNGKVLKIFLQYKQKKLF